MKKVLTILFLLLSVSTFAQYKLKVTVKSYEDNEILSGAHIFINSGEKKEVSDYEGKVVFHNLKAGNYIVKASFIGFSEQEKEIYLNKDTDITLVLRENAILTDEVVIKAVRAGEKTPSTYSNVDKELIKQENLGQDLPYLLESTPSVVVTSDAGTGVGYTGIRVRGTDISRINVTINGVPLNDPESHNVYFVNMPDFASSLENVQIQRGVGTSSNGAAAFGASINMQTTTLNPDSYVRYSTSAGSFNTFKNTLNFGTGLINDKFTVDARLSKLTSDGYIDRAFSDLKSYFVSAAYYGEKDILRFTSFSGKEVTYQAWGGISKEMLKTNRRFNPYEYDNETDNYQQDHYQLHYSRELIENLTLNSSLFYIHGRGYYEQYKKDQEMQEYGFDPLFLITKKKDTINSTNLIRRKWLKNDYYGGNLFFNYETDRMDLTFGGGYNDYEGDHYGRVIWAQYASNSNPDKDYYFNVGKKTDANVFVKGIFALNKKLSLYGDLQYRSINYDIEGLHDDMRDLTMSKTYSFFNPKAGIFFEANKEHKSYFSFAVANREPARKDFRDAKPQQEVKPEVLYDFELGHKFQLKNFMAEANLYYMLYKDQLVLTGELNDVGDMLTMNVPDSYRAGIELSFAWNIHRMLSWRGNFSFSRNKIKDFTYEIPNFSPPYTPKKETLSETTISFSPDIVANTTISIKPVRNLSIDLTGKYVSKQYIDNRQDDNWVLDPYFVSDLRLGYKVNTNFFKSIEFTLLVNNLFNAEYETNAWIYPYYYGGQITYDNGYFPQANRNFMFGITLDL
ncbi:MAG: TonB-dependent receptor [Hyphomicrobiales bacterium]